MIPGGAEHEAAALDPLVIVDVFSLRARSTGNGAGLGDCRPPP